MQDCKNHLGIYHASFLAIPNIDHPLRIPRLPSIVRRPHIRLFMHSFSHVKNFGVGLNFLTPSMRTTIS